MHSQELKKSVSPNKNKSLGLSGFKIFGNSDKGMENFVEIGKEIQKQQFKEEQDHIKEEDQNISTTISGEKKR